VSLVPFLPVPLSGAVLWASVPDGQQDEIPAVAAARAGPEAATAEQAGIQAVDATRAVAAVPAYIQAADGFQAVAAAAELSCIQDEPPDAPAAAVPAYIQAADGFRAVAAAAELSCIQDEPADAPAAVAPDESPDAGSAEARAALRAFHSAGSKEPYDTRPGSDSHWGRYQVVRSPHRCRRSRSPDEH
jgi:hypothetical protein